MTDKIKTIQHLLEKLKDFQNDNANFNIDSFEEWKKEAIVVLDKNQRMRFSKLIFYEVNDLPF